MEELLYMEDIPRLYTAIAEIAACAVGCLLAPRRVSDKRFIFYTLVAFGIQSLFLVGTDDVPLVLWLPCMGVAVLIMYLYYSVICAVPLKNRVFYTLYSFLLAEMVASLEWQLWLYFERALGVGGIGRSVTLIVVYAVAFFLIYFLDQRFKDTGAEIMEIKSSHVLIAVVITLFTFAVSNLSFVLPGVIFTASARPEIFSMRTLADIAGVAIFYGFRSSLQEIHHAREITRMTATLQSQYDGYRNYQEMIDLINFKYHDLKNQLLVLESETDSDKRNSEIATMRHELEYYRPEYNTGSPVLDVLLAGKTSRLRSADISLTCVADGALLSAMHVTDICSIFGNALDNAIEYETTLPEPDKRMIQVVLTEKKGFIFIEVSNYCIDEISMKNGDPVSPGKDTRLHGYGIKSIRHAVRKYDGTVTYTQENRMLYMRILIPTEKCKAG